MTREATLLKLDALGVLSAGSSAGLRTLYQRAVENADISLADYLTLRDVLELSGYREEPLHALLLCLFSALERGSISLGLSESALKQELRQFLDASAAKSWTERILRALPNGAFPELIGGTAGDGKPLVRIGRDGMERIYFQRYLKFEAALREQVAARSAPRSGTSAGVVKLKEILREVFEENPITRERKTVTLNAAQRTAVGLALLRNFVVISGGPGTGKTSIVFTLLRCLIRSGVGPERIGLAAPTGRAAQRMTASIRQGLSSLSVPPRKDSADAGLAQLRCGTVHQLLRYNPSKGTFLYGAEKRLSVDAVIVDEVSMLDVGLMSHLLSAVPPAAKVILLGDKDQLPPVEAGAVLGGLMPPENAARYSSGTIENLRQLFGELNLRSAASGETLTDSVVILDENYRSQKKILEFARSVNAGDGHAGEKLLKLSTGAADAPDLFTELPLARFQFQNALQQGGCWFADAGPGGRGELRQVLDEWAAEHYLAEASGGKSYAALLADCGGLALETGNSNAAAILEKIFDRLERSRVLTVLRAGPLGASGLNERFEAFLRPQLDPRGGVLYFAGQPILVTRNDPAKKLFNGDVGVVLCGADGYRAVFRTVDGFGAFHMESLPPHEPAFAMTVHKSQGSEYGRVLLVLPADEMNRLLTKELIYTAVTRAREMALIYGRPGVLSAAIGRSSGRETQAHLWDA